MAEEREDLKNDMPFEAARAAAAAPGYLGNRTVLAGLFRAALVEIKEALETAETEAEIKAALRGAARPLAAALLGGPGYTRVPAWNRPGAIDEFLHQHYPSEETAPARRVEYAVLMMLETLLFAKNAGEVQDLLNRYILLCLGVATTA